MSKFPLREVISYYFIGKQMENALLAKLKQSMAQKEFGQKFSEIMSTNIRLNRDDRTQHLQAAPINMVLPSISNAKAAITMRTKSQSAKRLPSKASLQKNNHQSSSKRIYKEPFPKDEASNGKRIDLQGLLVKKQSILQNSSNKPSSIRTKLFSLKTPTKQDERWQDGVRTKDITSIKMDSSKKASQRQFVVKQFLTKIQKMNENLLLTIKSGKIDMEFPDNKKIFSNLTKMKSSNEDQFHKINRTINKLIKFIIRYKIDHGNIEFKSITGLSNRLVLSNFELVNLFLNKSEIIRLHKIIGLQYYTTPEQRGHQLAASRIISFFKMLFSKRFYSKFRSLLGKVLVIQRYWRTCLQTKRARRQVFEAIGAKLERHNHLQKEFSKNWNIIKTSNRFEIHICSYSLQEFKRITMKNLKQRENNQITRIFRAAETDVNVIYVAPFHLQEDIIKYYNSIFQFNSNRIQQKLFFIAPQNKDRLQDYNLTTASLLLYSPKALKRIRQIVGKQFAYIVPSFPSIEYINLSAQLNVPILGSNQNLSKLYSTKSGCLKIFKNVASKQKPPFHLAKSVQSVFSQKQLINSIAVLIYKHKHIKCWYLKIEDEIQSRGLAYLNINKISFLRELCAGDSQFAGVEQTEVIKLIAEELSNKLKHRLKIINKDVYSDYDQFITHFLTRGGIIQAGIQGEKLTQFSISFFIDPCGEFHIIGTYNKLELGGKSINQSIKFPSIVAEVDYELITRNLYKEIWQKNKLFGYFTADFLTSEMFILPYAIGLDCFLNQKTSSLFMVNFCNEATYNKDTNRLSNLKNEELHYIYCPSLSLLKMPVTNTFFKNCKYQNISYDLEKKLGTIFILLDRLENEQLSFFCIESNIASLLKQVKKNVDYFSKAHRESKSTHDEIGLLKGAVTTWLKKYEKQKATHHQNLPMEIIK